MPAPNLTAHAIIHIMALLRLTRNIKLSGRGCLQLYYQSLRPLEGLANHAIPSKRTVVGGAFPSNSIA